MEAYYLLIIFLSILCILCRNKKALLPSFFFLFIIGGLRDVSVGTDSKNYMKLFEYYGDNVTTLQHANEPLYMIIQFGSAVSGIGYEGMQIICMVVMLVGLYVVIYKWSENAVYSVLCYVLLYFFFYSFNTTRQYLAIPFVLLSYYYLERNSKKKSMICVIIAIMFHFTAIVALLAFLMHRFRPTKNILILFLLGSFLIGLTPMAYIMAQQVAQHIPSFSEYATDTSEYRDSLFSISRLLLNVYALFIVLWFRDRDFKVSLLIIGVCILNMFSFQPVIGRLCQYFTIIQIIIIPAIPKLVKDKKMANPMSLASLTYMFISWIYLINSNVGEVVPWKYRGFILLT